MTTIPIDNLAQPDVAQGAPFTALLRVEGLETCDGRMWELGSSTWGPVPFPLMVQDTSSHGPDQVPEPAWAAGQVEEVFRDPNDPSRILGRGHLMPNGTGARAEDLARHAFRGVSCDSYSTTPMPPDLQPTVVDQDGDPLAILIRYSDDMIRRLTMVPTPAFEACCLWFDDEQVPQIAAEAHGAVIPFEAPEVVVVPNAYEQLVAAAGGPPNPPRAWFFTPEPDHYQPMQVSAQGQVTGHLARAGQCHIAYVGKCETAPTSRTQPPFKGFHRTVARCEDDSEVACGWVAMDTDHGNKHVRSSWSNEQVWDHYEHSGSLAAKVRASNGRHGIWLSGALLPGLSERQLAIVQGLSVSGHWHTYADPESGRTFGDELLAVLGGVPQPGFPETRTRPELLVASGHVVGRVGEFDPCDCEEGEPMTPEETARFEALEAKVDALVASGESKASVTLTVGEEFAAGMAEGLAAGAIAAEVTAAMASINGTDLVDLTEPLSAAEQARYIGRYDHDARAAMAAEGHALQDGSVPIATEQDLFDAIRSCASNERIRPHLQRAAVRLGREDLATGEWTGKVTLSQPA